MSQRRATDPNDGPERHRGARVFAAVAATVAVVGGMTVAAGAGSVDRTPMPRPVDPTPNRHAGVYDPAPVPPAEVERRCTEQFNSAPELDVRAASGWRLEPQPRRTLRLGTQVTLSAPGVTATCTIAEPDLAIGSGPSSRPIDTTGGYPTLVRECTQVAGYDFSGWTVTTKMAAADGFAAVLRSGNYYFAACQLGPFSDGPGAQAVTIRPAIASTARPYSVDLLALRRDALEIAPSDRGAVYTGAGMLFDAKGRLAFAAATLRLAFPDGRVITRPVVDGTYAVRAFVPGSSEASSVTITVVDGEGRRLAQYELDPAG